MSTKGIEKMKGTKRSEVDYKVFAKKKKKVQANFKKQARKQKRFERVFEY